jgi:glycosyltransferase involved in cell wall biosynthesis
VVDERTGFLIPSDGGEAGRFAETIDRILKAPDLRDALSAQARQQVEICHDRRRALSEYGALFA